MATNTTLCAAPCTVSAARYRGCASTLPSVDRKRSLPKLVAFTFASVSTVSVRFWPVRARSFLYVTTSVPEVTAAPTVRSALRLLALPAELLTTTAKLAPLSAVVAAGVV